MRARGQHPLHVLRIPFARNAAGVATTPSEATRGGRYHCPECAGLLVLRDGSRKVRHFAHRGDSACCALAGDGFVHRAAQHALVAVVERWRAGKCAAPVADYDCRVRATVGADACGRCASLSMETVGVARAEVEHVIGPRRVRLDVALLGPGGALVLAIEVRDTHPVDPAKRARLAGIPFIEVDALAVLQNWQLWRAEYHQDLERFGACTVPHLQPAPPSTRKARYAQMRKVIARDGATCLPVIALWNAPENSRAYHLVVPRCPLERFASRGVPCVGCAHHAGYAADPADPDRWPRPAEAWGVAACRHPALSETGTHGRAVQSASAAGDEGGGRRLTEDNPMVVPAALRMVASPSSSAGLSDLFPDTSAAPTPAPLNPRTPLGPQPRQSRAACPSHNRRAAG
jgi:hypothetical protein